ncbi:MAG: hypothetical protein NVS2B5_04470 [Beijerinckiaceae bacterium]
MTRFKKTLAAFIAASILGLGAAAMSSTPAAAWCNGFGCGGFGGPVGLGVGAAIAAGSIAATASAPAYYGPGPGYGGCYITREPVTDYYGNYRGSRRVRVCN